MIIKSAKFIKGAIGTDDIFTDGTPQIAFIGRSNVGKSSVINSLVNNNDLAKTSSFPGRTQEMNIFLINKLFYLVDLPGYGFAKLSKEKRESMEKMVNWYFFVSGYEQRRIVLIIDANVGLTKDDKEILNKFKKAGKNVVIVANKIDKLKKSLLAEKLESLGRQVGGYDIILYSAEKRFGVEELIEKIFV